jgi:flavin reductase ActVB
VSGARQPVPVANVGGALRDAMASFPSGVTIVTTTDNEGTNWGFTASSFCSLSMDPPLVLVCLARTATCFDAFMAADSWVINIVAEQSHGLAKTFATRGADKFAEGGFGVSDSGHPTLTDAAVSLHCDAWNRYDGGDHVILVGRVNGADSSEHLPSIWFRRTFHQLPTT